MMDAVHVDISSVARWFYEDNDDDGYSLDSFPVILSPWPMALYMFKSPRWINRHGKRDPYRAKPSTVYAAIRNDPIGDELRERYSYWNGINEASFIQAVEFELWAGNYISRSKGLLITDSEGVLCSDEFVSHPEAGFDSTLFHPVAFAISLLHCRNVEVRDRPVSRQQRRMAERRGKPLTTYKELVIDAFQTQIRYETQQEGGNEIKRALHICRGHFATYTDDNPLFGKHTGTFWRPMHVRGNKESGEVKKTYKVEGG